MKYKTMQQLAADAIAIQSACNLSGVARSLAEACVFLYSQVPSTRYVNEHPVVTLFIDKLASLNGGVGTADLPRLNWAWEMCRKWAEATE